MRCVNELVIPLRSRILDGVIMRLFLNIGVLFAACKSSEINRNKYEGQNERELCERRLKTIS